MPETPTQQQNTTSTPSLLNLLWLTPTAVFGSLFLMSITIQIYTGMIQCFGGDPKEYISKGGQFGDHFGFLNTMFSLITAFLVYKGFIHQQNLHAQEMQRLRESEADRERSNKLLMDDRKEAAQERWKAEYDRQKQERERHCFALINDFQRALSTLREQELLSPMVRLEKTIHDTLTPLNFYKVKADDVWDADTQVADTLHK
jgi:hypothetical protein